MIDIILLASSALIIVILVQWLIFMLSRPKNVPPGPFPLPLIGSIWACFGRDHCQFYRYLNETYGEAATVYVGSSITGMSVFLLDWDSVVEVSTARGIAEVVSNRPKNISNLRGVKEGILWAQYDTARDRKKFIAKAFKTLNLTATSSKKASSLLENEIMYLMERIETSVGHPVDSIPLLSEAMASASFLTTCGHRMDLNNADCLAMYEGLRQFTDSSYYEIMLLPYLKFIKPFFRDHAAEGERKVEAAMQKVLNQEVSFRLANFNSENTIGDVLDARLASHPDGKLDDGFIRSMVDSFGGTIDTTANTICWALFYLAHMPDEQERLRHELESVLLNSTVALLDYRSKLPRLNAFLAESARFSGLTVGGFPRRCSAPIEFGRKKKYQLPENTIVTVTVFPIHFDKDYWLDPENFRIDRWLDPSDDHFVSHTHFIPFSIGRRSCPGEQLARNFVLLFVSAFIRRFIWRLADHVPFSGYRNKLMRIPPEHKLIFSLRQ